MIINYKFNKQDYVSNLFCSVIFLIGLTSYLFNNFNLTAIAAFLINFLFLLKFRRKIPVFILFFYILLHTNIFIYKLLFNVQISFWTDFLDNKYISTALLSHLIFIFTLGITINSENKIFNNSFNLTNKYVYLAIAIILVFILFKGITGENIINTGSYSSSGNAEKSTLHEYFLLFFIALTFFSSNKRIYKLFEFALLLIYIFKTLLYGGRIEVVQIILIYLLLNFILPGKLKFKFILTFLIIGIYLSSVASNFRDNPSILFSENYLELFNPKAIFELPNNGDLLSTTQGDVVQSSARIIGLIDTNLITTKERILSFLCYLSSPIIPQSMLPNFANLSTYRQEIFMSGGGGMISTYFYAWLWYFGPFFIASLIGYFINQFYKFNSITFHIYGIALLSTFPRWFSYNPIFLIKFCLYSVLFFYLSIYLKNNFFVINEHK